MRHRGASSITVSERWGISGWTVKLSINHKQSATINMGHFPGPRLPTEPGNCDVCGWKVRGCGVSLPAAGLEAWLVCDWDFWATPTLDSDTFNPNWQPLDETAPTSEATHYITLSFDWIQFKAAFHCVTSLTLGIHSSQIKIPNQNDRNRGIDYHFFFFCS